MDKTRERLLLIGVLGTAFLLRCLLLNKESLWLDEFVTWWCVSRDFSAALAAEVTNPPLYYLLLFPWVKVFGLSEIALRSFSILPSIGSVYLAYRFGKRFESAPVGLLAAGYQAVSSFHVFYAQEARTHAWLVFFLLLTSWTLLDALEAAPGRATVWGFVRYGVLAVACLYMHFTATFFLAGHAVYVLWRWWREKDVNSGKVGGFLLAGIGATVCFGPWLFQMLRAASGGGQVRRYLALKLPQAYFSFLFGDTLIPLDEEAVRHVLGTLKEFWFPLTAAVLACALIIPALLRLLGDRGRKLAFPLILSTAPLLICLAVSLKVMVFDERYMQTASPFLYVLLAAAFFEGLRTGGVFRRTAQASAVLFAGLSVVSLWQYYTHPRYGKEQWREAVAAVDAQGTGSTGNTGNTVLLLEPDYLHHCYNYYTRKHLPLVRILTPEREAILAGHPERIPALAGAGRVVFLRSHFPDDEILNALEKRWRETRRQSWPKGKGIESYTFDSGDSGDSGK